MTAVSATDRREHWELSVALHRNGCERPLGTAYDILHLLKRLAARDKAQVFVLPGLKDHFIFDPPDLVNYFK